MQFFLSKIVRLFICTAVLLATSNSFADFVGRKGATLSNSGDTVYNSFSISETTTFTLYAAAEYSASIIIFDTSSLNSFLNGSSVSYYDGFSGNFGIKTITLGPGEYTLGARNSVNGENTISYELEYAPVEVSGAQYVDTYFTNVDTVSPGSKLWHGFTVQSGYAYVVEGLNTGLDSYLIPESELNNFKNNQSFSYFPSYSASNDPNQPGLYVIRDLAPGNYYLALSNSSAKTRAVVYAMYRYSDDSANGSGSNSGSGSSGASDVNIDGAVSYSIENDYIQIDVEKISNTGGAASGTLGMSVWATSSPYDGGSISGYKLGEYALTTLDEGYYYQPFTLSDQLNVPPNGVYYVTLVLTEVIGGEAYIVDYVSFSNTVTFGQNNGNSGAYANFDGSVLSIPYVLLPDNSIFSVELTYLLGSNPPRLVLSAASPISSLGSNPATVTGSVLTIPEVVFGNDVYELELLLVSDNPISFELIGAQ